MRRIEQHGAGDRQPLPLAAGEVEAAFAEDGVVAVRQGGDEVVGRGDLRGLFDLGERRLGMAEGDVGRDGVAEQKCLLKDEADVPPQVVEIEIAQVVAVEQNPPARRIVKAAEQRQQRRLARARSRQGSRPSRPAR